MVTLKKLKAWAREEGVIGFSRMSKAELEELWESSQPEEPRKYQPRKKRPVDILLNRSMTSLERLKRKVQTGKGKGRKKIPILNYFMTQALPKNISNLLETSTNKAVEWAEKAISVKDYFKEKARKNLLRLNAKIAELLKKPEFEITEKRGLAGKRFTIFLKNNRKSLINILKKNPGTKVKMVLHCLMSSADLKTGEEIEDVGFFPSLVEEVFEGTDFEELLDLMFARTLETMANFRKGKSNWRFVRVEKLQIQVDEMSHDDGVGEWLPLPQLLEKKKRV